MSRREEQDLLHWMQYRKGYVTIKVWGYSTERFLNLCGNHNILVWDITDYGSYITMNVSVEGFFELKPLLHKTGTRAAILKKYGLPFCMKRAGKRKVFLAGLLGCMAFWMLTSQFIWNIRIQGNFSITEDVMMDYLKEQGIYVSMRQKDLQIEELEKAIRERYDEITWVSVQVEGTTLQIDVKENEMPSYETEELSKEAEVSSGYDLIATHSGVVSYIITRSGVPQVMPGESVAKGDLLVSGAVPVYNDDETIRRYEFCHADADILIQYEAKLNLEENVAYVRKVYSGRERHNRVLELSGHELQCTLRQIPYEYYDVWISKRQFCLLDGLYLPLYVGQRSVREYTLQNSVHTEEEMQEIFQERWNKIISSFHEKGVQIIQKDVTMKKNDKKWVLSGRLLLEESAVQLRQTQTEQTDTAATEEALQENPSE